MSLHWWLFPAVTQYVTDLKFCMGHLLVWYIDTSMKTLLQYPSTFTDWAINMGTEQIKEDGSNIYNVYSGNMKLNL